VSKFLLNLLVEILKVLPKFQKSLKFKNIFSFEFPLGARPSRLSFTTSACLFRRPPFPSSVRWAHARLWHIPQNKFSSLICVFHPRHLLSLPSLTHGPRLSAPSRTPHQPTPTMPPLNPTSSNLPAPPSSMPQVAACAP
jgi:hypothetical protein